MSLESIDARLRQVFSQVLDLPVAEVSDSTAPDNTPSWDSLAHLRLVMAVEGEFSITIPAEQVMDMISFKIARLVIEEQTSA